MNLYKQLKLILNLILNLLFIQDYIIDILYNNE